MPQESLRRNAAPGGNGPLPLRFHPAPCNRATQPGIPRLAKLRPPMVAAPPAGPGCGRRVYAIT